MAMRPGRHIKVLGEGPAHLMRNVATVEALLRDLASQLGMRLLVRPHVYRVEEEIDKLGVEPFQDEGGVTGVAVLSTSHCAIHTWPLRKYFVLDIYSCRDFDPSVVGRVLKRRLGFTRICVSDLSGALEPNWDKPDRALAGSTRSKWHQPSTASAVVESGDAGRCVAGGPK